MNGSIEGDNKCLHAIRMKSTKCNSLVFSCFAFVVYNERHHQSDV